jgi:uncharacterized protein (TIGR02147 family)
MQPLFEYADYKAFLRAVGEERPRGFRKALAQATGCQTAYVSQVLNGQYHFSLEQADAAAAFLGFTKEESKFFLLLVERQRAGTDSLRAYFAEQLEESRSRHLLLKHRLGVQASLGVPEQSRYYSCWQYSAVHMAVTIPKLQTRPALARALGISPRKLSEVLDFLGTVGLIQKKGERYLPGATQLHLSKDSPLIAQHHANWRQQGLAKMHSDHAGEGIHYSSVSSLSAADARKIKAQLTTALSDAVRAIKDSPEEVLFGINLDFFRVDE